jgi:dihydroorotate dehydrogenase
MALYPILRPAIFALDAERAHRLTISALKLKAGGKPPAPDPLLGMRVAGLDFPNPVGLAAGFDKDAEVAGAMLALGFGFVEVGTLTPRAQPGNPKPRLFRLPEDKAVINRFGFNNQGQEAAAARLAKRDRKGGIVGANIGANKQNVGTDAAIADYAAGVRAMAPVADYLTVNISSPNTPGLRALQDKGALAELLAAVVEARGGPASPLFLKVAPDLEPKDVQDIASVAVERKMDALIVSNTTILRPGLRSRHKEEAGGLSGAPIRHHAMQRLKDFAEVLDGALPLIAAGGIATGAEAWARIKAGASLVQLYTALVYEGPGLARRMLREMKALAEREGFGSVADAVGVDRHPTRVRSPA